MRYVVAVFLEAGSWVEELRRKFDPLAGSVPAHVTLVHPFESSMSAAEVRSHLRDSVRHSNPFELEVKGVTGFRNEYLFLNVKKGNDDLIRLRDSLYQGRWAKYLDPSETFLPHVTVGRLVSSEEFQAALADAQAFDGVVALTVEEVSAYSIAAGGQREMITRVPLGKRGS